MTEKNREVNLSDFTLELIKNDVMLHELWLEYRKHSSLDQFLDDIEPKIRLKDEAAIRLLRFSYTWMTGNAKLKDRWYKLMNT